MEDLQTQLNTTQPPPLNQNTNQVPKPNKTTIIIAGTGLAILLIVSIIIIMNGQRNNSVLTLPAQTENTTPIATPTPIITDTAPSVPSNQKEKIIVHHSDSSFETFLVPTTNTEIFKKSLQPGDTISQIIPPAAQ